MNEMRYISRVFFGGEGVGLPISDILFWVGPPKLDTIGYGWVGRSKKGQKNRISFMDGP